MQFVYVIYDLQLVNIIFKVHHIHVVNVENPCLFFWDPASRFKRPNQFPKDIMNIFRHIYFSHLNNIMFGG